jgi:hypothetical protein
MEEASFARRGFTARSSKLQARLEEIGRTFVAGYDAAVTLAEPDALPPVLDAIPAELRGFACEGAGMGFALLDLVAPWPARRFQRYLAGVGRGHVYMAYVGAGWALARLSPRLRWRLGPLDPLLHWLAFDGFGFHEGYFHHHDSIDRQDRPRALASYARNSFDQGLGRSLWFVRGGDVDRVARTVAAFPPERRADLWSGVGLAAAYAGGVAADDLAQLGRAAGTWRAHLGQGAAFAAKARERAGNPAEHTALACRIFCGRSASEAASLTDLALGEVHSRPGIEPYEAWRAGIRAGIAGGNEVVSA